MAVRTWQNRGSYDPKLANATHPQTKKPKGKKSSKTRQTFFRENDKTRLLHAVTIYVDGGCWPNDGTGRGGWGLVCVEDNFESFGGKERTTNNQMELMGVLAALRYVKTNHPQKRVLIRTDSQYAINSSSVWMQGWKKRGWKTSTGEPVKNRDLLEQIDELLPDLYVEFNWVPGHSGNRWNERVDELARLGSGRAVNHDYPNTPKVPVIEHTEPCKTCQASVLDTILDLWDRGGFTPAFEIAVAEIKRLQGLLK